MYYSKKKTHSSLEEINLLDIDGFLMKSKKGLKVQDSVITPGSNLTMESVIAIEAISPPVKT